MSDVADPFFPPMVTETIVHRPASELAQRARARLEQRDRAAADRSTRVKNAPVLVTGAWRFAAKVVVLGLVGILALPVLLFFRVRRLVRFMFARRDDA